MVGRNAAAREGVGLQEAVVAATRRAAGRRSSIKKVRMKVVGRKERRKGRKGMLVRSLVGRAAARRRGRNVLPRTQCLVCVGARALPSSYHTTSEVLSALTPPLRGGDTTKQMQSTVVESEKKQKCVNYTKMKQCLMSLVKKAKSSHTKTANLVRPPSLLLLLSPPPGQHQIRAVNNVTAQAQDLLCGIVCVAHVDVLLRMERSWHYLFALLVALLPLLVAGALASVECTLRGKGLPWCVPKQADIVPCRISLRQGTQVLCNWIILRLLVLCR